MCGTVPVDLCGAMQATQSRLHLESGTFSREVGAVWQHFSNLLMLTLHLLAKRSSKPRHISNNSHETCFIGRGGNRFRGEVPETSYMCVFCYQRPLCIDCFLLCMYLSVTLFMCCVCLSVLLCVHVYVFRSAVSLVVLVLFR